MIASILHAVQSLGQGALDFVATSPGLQGAIGAAVGGAVASLATVKRAAKRAAHVAVAVHERNCTVRKAVVPLLH